MSARTLRDELMDNTIWIRNHVGECFQTISRQVFISTLLPLIEHAANSSQNQIDLERRVARLAYENLGVENEISKAVDCINGKVIHEAKSRNLPTLETLYLLLSCSLLGRFLYDMCWDSGFIS